MGDSKKFLVKLHNQPGTIDLLAVAVQIVSEATKIHRQELKELRAEVAELKARPPSMEYQGVWKAGTFYKRGQTATDHGGTWHCNQDTYARPGESGDWTLCCARGKPGKTER